MYSKHNIDRTLSSCCAADSFGICGTLFGTLAFKMFNEEFR